MKLRRALVAWLLALAVVIPTLNLVGFAHHSRAHYGTEESTTKGIVVEYKWRNPHVYVVWAVTDQSGKTTQWIGEMASLTSMIADGMTKDSLKMGDEVTVVAFPSKNPGSTEALIKKITKGDGRVVIDRSRVRARRAPKYQCTQLNQC